MVMKKSIAFLLAATFLVPAAPIFAKGDEGKQSHPRAVERSNGGKQAAHPRSVAKGYHDRAQPVHPRSVVNHNRGDDRSHDRRGHGRADSHDDRRHHAYNDRRGRDHHDRGRYRDNHRRHSGYVAGYRQGRRDARPYYYNYRPYYYSSPGVTLGLNWVWHSGHRHYHRGGYCPGYYDNHGHNYSHNYYRNNSSGGNEVAGAVVGGIVGGILGSAIDGGRNKTTGAVLGTVIGATIGASAAKSSDRDRYDSVPVYNNYQAVPPVEYRQNQPYVYGTTTVTTTTRYETRSSRDIRVPVR